MKKAKQTRKTASHHAHMRHAARVAGGPRRAPLIAVRRSRIQGTGVYAARRIRKGTRIVAYVGERISHYPLWRDFPYEYETDRLAIDLINGGLRLREWVDDQASLPGDLDAMARKDESQWQSKE